jgi:thiol-disulfide isomerase/thioredoxin
VEFELYTSTFCGPCRRARQVLADAARLVPAIRVHEYDVVRDENQARVEEIRSTPTVIVRDARGRQVFRAQGAPTLNQVLAAAAAAL